MVRGAVFVVAIGSSSCGDTSEGDFVKRSLLEKVEGSHWRTASIKDR